MREGTTERGITNLFELPLIAHIPLGAEDKLGNPDYPIACTFIYGDNDWVQNIDDQASLRLIQKSKFYDAPCPRSNTKSQYHLVPNAGHNVHLDNPFTFVNILVNDLLGMNA